MCSFFPDTLPIFSITNTGQSNERKYIGVILTVNGMDYFEPLSSFKDKHSRMEESVDFIKVKRYAVININNMFPVPDGLATYVDISKEKNERYRSLLLAEYRAIKGMQEKIRRMQKSSISIELKMAHQLLWKTL